MKGLTIAAVIVVEGALAAVASRRPTVAVASAIGVVVIAIASFAPVTIGLAVLPATWIATRVGPSNINLSVADAALLVATAVAFFHVPWKSRAVRIAIGFAVAYLAMLLVPVVAHPTHRAWFEWLHRGSLTFGPILVGGMLAARGLVHRALQAFLLTTGLFSVVAVIDSVRSSFQPAYPLGAHKNAAGSLIAAMLVVTVVRPGALRTPSVIVNLSRLLLVCGLAATQNRGAAVAIVVTLAIWMGSRPGRVKGNLLALIASAPLLLFVLISFSNEEKVNSNSNFSSVNSRRLTYEYTLDLWRTDPIVGVGLRFWNDPFYRQRAITQGRITFGEPHNLEVSALGESGIVGLAALTALVSGSLMAISKSQSDLRSMAVFVLIEHVVDAQFGIWWVAGTSIAPLVIVGLSLAVAQSDPPVASTVTSRPLALT